ncbi:MAG: STAS domain-containing protein [Planctomycetota bacterium]|nr:STAS domain-containing protein [Planctomycetota bacterium]
MPTDWSDDILISDLSDEPALSDELNSIYERISAPEVDRPPHCILNFGAVTYLNSSNIAQMLRLRKRLTERDRRLVICSVADPVWSVMLLTGLDKVFTFAPEPATAIASLQIEGGRS